MNLLRRKFLYVAAALLSPLLAGLFLGAGELDRSGGSLIVPVAYAELSGISGERPPLADLAESDPLAVARLGRQRYDREVRGYRSILLKQEFLDGKLTEIQQVEVRYREAPQSVYMIWRQNEDQARRALYLPHDPQYTDSKGRKLARVEPAGAVVSIFVKDIFMPIDGPEARASSRRSIAECGFKAAFEILDRVNEVGRQNKVLEYKYGGVGEVDGRATYVFTRHLPYAGEGGTYPDAKMVMHLDQEWLLPTAIYSYADREGKQLLGSYVFTKVELNPNFGADAFQF